MEPQPASNRQVDEPVIERLFMALHGYFGNRFLENLRLGEQQDGKDRGVENAKRIWLAELRAFSVIEIFGALHKIRDSGGAFAPSLPEFVAACKACRRSVTFDPGRALPAPQSGGVLKRLTAQRQGLAMQPSGGLATLFAVTARAVGQAGGDEVMTLRELERRFTAEWS